MRRDRLASMPNNAGRVSLADALRHAADALNAAADAADVIERRERRRRRREELADLLGLKGGFQRDIDDRVERYTQDVPREQKR